jgi:hypothetical protein
MITAPDGKPSGVLLFNSTFAVGQSVRDLENSIKNGRNKQKRSGMGALFYSVCNELSDITWIEAFRPLVKTFLEVAADKYLLKDDEIELLLEAFIAALPTPLRDKPLQCA